jgi:hypothetical protein
MDSSTGDCFSSGLLQSFCSSFNALLLPLDEAALDGVPGVVGTNIHQKKYGTQKDPGCLLYYNHASVACQGFDQILSITSSAV